MKIKMTFLFLLTSVLCWQNSVAQLNPFSLTSPPDNTILPIAGDPTAVASISWDAASAVTGVTYE